MRADDPNNTAAPEQTERNAGVESEPAAQLSEARAHHTTNGAAPGGKTQRQEEARAEEAMAKALSEPPYRQDDEFTVPGSLATQEAAENDQQLEAAMNKAAELEERLPPKDPNGDAAHDPADEGIGPSTRTPISSAKPPPRASSSTSEEGERGNRGGSGGN